MDDQGRKPPKLEMGIDPASIPNDVRVIVRAHRRGNGQLIRLKRLPGKGWTGGVCAGIAYRLGCRPYVVRLAFVLSTLTFGLGAALYVPLRLFLPVPRRIPRDFNARVGKAPDPDDPDDPE